MTIAAKGLQASLGGDSIRGNVDCDPQDRPSEAGELSVQAQGWRRGSRLDPHETFGFEMIEVQKDITLNEMEIRLAADMSIWLSCSGWAFKKSSIRAGAGTSEYPEAAPSVAR